MPQHTAKPHAVPLANATRDGWPRPFAELPVFLTQRHLAELLGVSIRTLERQRHVGGSIPFRKMGRKVLYGREDVVNFLDGRTYGSTAEAKRAASQSKDGSQ